MDVIMPQLGETVAEGTVTVWHKKVGDKIEADELLFEVGTDKVETGIPAPVAGRGGGARRCLKREPSRPLSPLSVGKSNWK